MSVIDFQENYRGRTATKDRANLRAKRQFIIQTDDGDDTQPIIIDYSEVPDINDRHPDDGELRVSDYSLKPRGDSKTLWDLTVNYEKSTVTLPGNNTEEEVIDPTLEPAEVNWGFRTLREPVEKDINGKAITNSAGDAFEYGSIQRDIYQPVLTITKIEADYSLLLLEQYIGAVNSVTCRLAKTQFRPRTVLCTGIPAQRVIIRGESYWRVTYQFMMRYEYDPAQQFPNNAQANGWDLTPLDVGWNYLDGSGNLIPYQTDDGRNRVTPGPLDGSTGAKASTHTEVTSVPNSAVVPFRIYRGVNFAALGLQEA